MGRFEKPDRAHLSFTHVGDLSPLKDLKNLTSLDINDNHFSDLDLKNLRSRAFPSQ
jgi:Leucine-rich repeat (LRR) protein